MSIIDAPDHPIAVSPPPPSSRLLAKREGETLVIDLPGTWDTRAMVIMLVIWGLLLVYLGKITLNLLPEWYETLPGMRVTLFLYWCIFAFGPAAFWPITAMLGDMPLPRIARGFFDRRLIVSPQGCALYTDLGWVKLPIFPFYFRRRKVLIPDGQMDLIRWGKREFLQIAKKGGLVTFGENLSAVERAWIVDLVREETARQRQVALFRG